MYGIFEAAPAAPVTATNPAPGETAARMGRLTIPDLKGQPPGTAVLAPSGSAE